MKGQTKHLTEQVRAALLALPDAVLMQTLAQWLDSIDEHLLVWSDECRSALGYRIQSDETHKLYASFEELGRAEPEGAGGSWMGLDAQTLRTALGTLSLEQLYHIVIALASEALALQASEEAWGVPPLLSSQRLSSPHEVPPLLVDNEKLYHLGTGLPTCYNSIVAEANEQEST